MVGTSARWWKTMYMWEKQPGFCCCVLFSDAPAGDNPPWTYLSSETVRILVSFLGFFHLTPPKIQKTIPGLAGKYPKRARSAARGACSVTQRRPSSPSFTARRGCCCSCSRQRRCEGYELEILLFCYLKQNHISYEWRRTAAFLLPLKDRFFFFLFSCSEVAKVIHSW